VEQVVCLLHSDLHEHKCCTLVEHTSSTVIKMRQPSTNHHMNCCDILHKKISGKITKIVSTSDSMVTEMYSKN